MFDKNSFNYNSVFLVVTLLVMFGTTINAENTSIINSVDLTSNIQTYNNSGFVIQADAEYRCTWLPDPSQTKVCSPIIRFKPNSDFIVDASNLKSLFPFVIDNAIIGEYSMTFSKDYNSVDSKFSNFVDTGSYSLVAGEWYAVQVNFNMPRESTAKYNLTINDGVTSQLFDPTISNCGIVAAPGIYKMTGDFNSTGTCLSIWSADVWIDCDGYSFAYGYTGGTAYGVVTNATNTTIKNCHIYQSGPINVVNTSHAIYFNGALVTNGVIYNNSINTTGWNSIAVRLESDSTTLNTNISFNNISTIGDYSYGTYIYSNANHFTNNTITTSGDGAYVIQISYGSTNNLFNDTVLNTYHAGTGDIKSDTSGTNNYTNCTFDKSNVTVSAGTLNFLWYTNTHVIDSTGTDVDTANVNISKVNGIGLVNLTTNSTGWTTPLTIQEYKQNVTGTYNYTPHWFNASKSGISNNTLFSVSNNLLITLTLPIYIATPTPVPIPQYGTTEIIVKLFPLLLALASLILIVGLLSVSGGLSIETLVSVLLLIIFTIVSLPIIISLISGNNWV